LFQKAFSARSLQVNYFLALFFGLVHGMGYANAIRFSLAKGQGFGISLFSFNLGLEIGQIFVVLLMLLANIAVIRTGFFNRREWVLVYSALVMGLAIQIALERNPF
jgi:hypothetical protein